MDELRGENFLTQHSPAHSLEGCCAPPPSQAPRDQAASASAHELSCAWPFFGVSSSQLSLLPAQDTLREGWRLDGLGASGLHTHLLSHLAIHPNNLTRQTVNKAGTLDTPWT